MRISLLLAGFVGALVMTTTSASPSRTAPRPAAWVAFHADPGGSGDLYLDSVDGARRRRLTTRFGQMPTAAWSPDGSKLAFLARPSGTIDVYVIGADGGALRRLTRGEGDHFGDVAWSPDGKRIAFTCCGEGAADIFLIGADGKGRVLLAKNAGQAVWSPDGSKIAFLSFRDGNPELYSVNRDRSDLRRLTSNKAEDVDPAWSPDGRRIAFTSKRDGAAQIYVMAADGSDQQHLVTDRWSDQRPSWSPDGRVLFTSFRNRDPNLLGIGNAEILVANSTGKMVRNLTRSRYWEGMPSWSPNGRQIAFATRRDFGPLGGFRVAVMGADGTHRRLLPAVPDPRNRSGLASSCCPVWHP